MRLIVGGRAQGKLDWVLRETGYGRERVSCGTHDPKKPVLDHFELLVKDFCERETPLDPLLEILCSGDVAVICDEVGCGVVPMDAAQRRWRDEVGRACQILAAAADRVDRVFCGIGTPIKGGN